MHQTLTQSLPIFAGLVTPRIPSITKSCVAIPFSRSNRLIPTPVHDCLEQVILPSVQRINKSTGAKINILLRGGCAVACYFPSARPVSPDIDFTALLRHEDFDKFHSLMRCIDSAGQLQTYGTTPSEARRSTYIKGKVNLTAGHQENLAYAQVSVDAVWVRRVAQDFCFEFSYDSHLDSHRLQARLDNNETIGVVAPELTLIEKLTAARGIEKDKFDLLDATGILVHTRLNLDLMQRIIAQQHYRSLIDPPLQGDISPNQAKRRALVQRLLSSLDRIDQLATCIDPRLFRIGTPAQIWGAHNITTAVEYLRQYLQGADCTQALACDR